MRLDLGATLLVRVDLLVHLLVLQNTELLWNLLNHQLTRDSVVSVFNQFHKLPRLSPGVYRAEKEESVHPRRRLVALHSDRAARSKVKEERCESSSHHNGPKKKTGSRESPHLRLTLDA